MTSSIQQHVTEITFLDNAVIAATERIAKALSPVGVTVEAKRASNSAWEARQQALEGIAPKFPLVSVTIGQVEDSPDFMWNKQALFNGLYTKDPNFPGVIKQIKLNYVKVTLRVTVETEDGKQLLDMIKRWKFRERKVQFNLTNYGLRVTCKCLFDNSFTFPEQQVTESGNTFSGDFSATLYTYVGEVIEIPAIKEEKVILELRQNKKVIDKTTVAKRRL